MKTSDSLVMQDWFKRRTMRHIKLVQKYAGIIEESDPERFAGLRSRAEVHDRSKFVEPEYEPYVLISWQYKCLSEGVPFKLSSENMERLSRATLHHVTNNRHHPEFHSNENVHLEARENSKKTIDASNMTDVDIAEMVADWLAMSKEKDNSCALWAKKNIGVRWTFSLGQEELIYALIKLCKR